MPSKIDDHNSFYLSEDRRDQPREFFKFLVQVAESELSTAATVLDVGCATGDFLHYVRSLYPTLVLTGIDISPEFVAKARAAVPDASFSIGNIYTGAQLPAQRFDVVFMSGVNYLFPEYESWLRNIVALTKKSAFVYGIFNPEDLDVCATVRRSGDTTSSTSWNLISEKSISNFLQGLGVRHRFIRWSLPIENPRIHADPMRSWTIETKDSGFLVVNGTQMIQRFAALQITVS
ncbi:MAG: class I SAM-dependent methyltransferase [Candidatus Korobacteraceae bacterium]